MHERPSRQNRELEGAQKLIKDLPTGTKVIIVTATTAAGLIAVGFPGAVAGFTVGELSILVINRLRSN